MLLCLSGPWPPNCWPDINIDGTVDGGDLGAMLGNWLQPCDCNDCSQIVIEDEAAARATAALEMGLRILGFKDVEELNVWREKSEPKQAEALLAWLLEYCAETCRR